MIFTALLNERKSQNINKNLRIFGKMEENKLYELVRVSSQLLIAFSTSYINPMSSLLEIEKELRQIGFEGRIIFDLLLSNGLCSNRFMEAIVKENKIDKFSIKILKNAEPFILDRATEFYQTHEEFVYNSILLEEEIADLFKYKTDFQTVCSFV
ncbi:MAG: hypothetical protein HC890_05545 [Chloroflexaceae bacterium]|nr:hypothetical protein [Chloroflexaceae bacterium]